jgi:hypothetical protein
MLAVHLWNQLRQERNQLAELRLELAQLKSATTGPAPAAAGTEAAPSPALPGTPVPAVAGGAPGTAVSLLVTAPNCEGLLSQLTQSAERNAAATAAELKLAPAEAEKLAEIRVAQLLASQSCGTQQSRHASAEQLQAQLEALLGPTRYEQMQESSARRTAELNMATFRGQLKVINAPLDDEQARQLMEIILEANRRTRREAGSPAAPEEPYARLAFEEKNLRLTEERFERILTAAQAILRPSQLAQLRTNMTQQVDAMTTVVARLRASVEAGQGIPAAQQPIVTVAPGN